MGIGVSRATDRIESNRNTRAPLSPSQSMHLILLGKNDRRRGTARNEEGKKNSNT